MLSVSSLILDVVSNHHMIGRSCERIVGRTDRERSLSRARQTSVWRMGPPVVAALVLLTGCGGSVWSDGFQRAISVIPGIEVAGALPAEDEAVRPGYQPPAGEIVAAQDESVAEPEPAPVPMPVAEAPMNEAPMGEALLMAEAAQDNSVLGRMQRVELGMLRLEADFQAMRPSIERLLAVEADLDELVAQLFQLVAQGPAPGAPMAARQPPMEPVRQPADGAPMPLIPAGDGGVPEMAPAAAEPPAMGGRFALHLASYRERENALAGWNEIRAAVPNQLSDLQPGTSLFDKGADGQFVRLKAGPLATEAEAEARCRAIQAAGLYCAVMPYQGTSPL